MKITLLALTAMLLTVASYRSALLASSVSISTSQAGAANPSTMSPAKIRKVLAFDDFHRSDRRLAGNRLLTGQTWEVAKAGSPANAAIINHLLISNGDATVYVRLSDMPSRFGAKFSWAGDPRTAEGVALTTGKENWIRSRVSTYIDSVSIRALWNDENSGGPLANCTGNPYFKPSLSTNGTAYQVYITTAGNSIHFEGSNGIDYQCTDPHVGALAGRVIGWGIWGDRTFNLSQIHEVEADN